MLHIAKFAQGATVSLEAETDITAGRLVSIGAKGTIGHTGAAKPFFGVANADAKPGDLVAVGQAGIRSLLTSTPVTAGDEIQATADGKIGKKTDPAPPIGQALETATKDSQVLVKLYQ